MKRKKWYVGLKGSSRMAFAQATPPDQATSSYDAVIGPFRTKRAARFLKRHGANNPHCQTVAQAEKLAKTAPPDND